MPIYEYECTQCGQPFEFLLRGEEKPTCPNCGSKKLRKQFSKTSVHTGGSRDSACPTRGPGACGISGCPDGGCCGLGG